MSALPWRRTGPPAAEPSPAPRRRTVTILWLGLFVVLTATLAFSSVVASLAVFNSGSDGSAVFGTKTLFAGQRVTPAFTVIDRSSGSSVDRSSPFLTAADGLTTTTSAWSSTFSGSRWLEFDLNQSLPAGVAVSGASFTFRFSSSGAGQACFSIEVRRASSGAVLATHGSGGSPLGCVTGGAMGSTTIAIPSVTTTDLANDLRIRVYGAESGGAGMVIDVATVSGSTPYQSFSLAPIVFRDAADTTPEVIPWRLMAP